ncbi:hypothetical protein EUGRSUZ_G00880 [Eucalyptus grandis]|uniref:Uncharacterized protein n=2 Tax=Eucalyptus grandis TaxID=71139 RepID=A0ACC3K218_EUCGR|nr:hypothetical protein EUGRSUZ_G00880 [Eucalyptus grandis]
MINVMRWSFPFGSMNAIASLSSTHSLLSASSLNKIFGIFDLISLPSILLLESTHAQKACLKRKMEKEGLARER